MKKNYVRTNIIALRDYWDETQEQLADAIGVKSISTISQYESGKRMPKRDILRKIALHYHVQEYELEHEDLAKSLIGKKIMDAEDSEKIFLKILPVVCSPEAVENKKFCEAYEKNIELYEKLKKGDIKNIVDDYIFIAEQYELLYKQNNIIEAGINLLPLIYSIGTAFFINDFPIISKYNELDNNTLAKSFLRPMNDDFESYENEIKRRNVFIDDYDDMVTDILKNMYSSGYVQLAEYYTALKYLFGLVDTDKEVESITNIGNGMMEAFAILGNEYASNLLLLMHT